MALTQKELALALKDLELRRSNWRSAEVIGTSPKDLELTPKDLALALKDLEGPALASCNCSRYFKLREADGDASISL